MFVLLVQFTVYAGKEEQARDLMRKMEEHTRREPGCKLYIGCRSNEDPRSFLFYEQYVDQKALETHWASPHFEQYVTNGLKQLMETVKRETFTTIEA